MALVVNQNLSAMNAHYYMKKSENTYSKQVEKLSSGLRINRAADDPAGLVISEKYRAQIDGLKQGIKNAQDGISLVQTAEGALDEVATTLRTMRTLALHAANVGVNDSEALEADQKQIQSAIDTLNRIAQYSQFGSKTLFDGSAGVKGTSNSSDLSFISAPTSIDEGAYTVNITQSAVKGSVYSDAKKTQGIAGTVDAAGTSTTAEDVLTFSGDAFTEDYELTIASGSDAAATAAIINADETLANAGIYAEVYDDGTGTEYLNIKSRNLTEFTVNATLGNGDGGLEDTFGITQAVMTSNTTSVASQVASGDAKMGADETITFRNANKYVQVQLTAGTTLSEAVNQINKAVDKVGIKVTASYDSTTGVFKLENNEYGDDTVVKNTISTDLAAADLVKGLGIADTTDGEINVAAGSAAENNTDGENVAGTIGGKAATGKGQILTVDAGSELAGLKVRVSATGITGATDVGKITIEQNSLSFQIGANANQTVQLSLSDLRADKLGVAADGTTYNTGADINVAAIDVTAGNGQGAQDAVLILDAAIAQISQQRADMGSFQKDVLESTVRNLGVAAQNMSASESIIRDADMAEEMLTYSRAQVLQQTSMAMLSQANQSPQQIMKLFQ